MNAAPSRRLLIVSPWARMWSLGGSAGVSDEYRFLDGFTRAGYEIHLVLPGGDDAGGSAGGGHADFAAIRGVHLHPYPDFFASMEDFPVAAKRLAWLPLFNALVGPRALRLAREVQPDAVLGFSHYATATTWACRRRLGIPSVVKLFGVMDLVHTEWPAAKYWFKNFEQIVALKFSQDAWIILDDGTRGGDVARGRGIPADRIHFLPNGVNLEWQGLARNRSAARDRFGLPPDADVVLFLARLVASKRPDELVRAIPAVRPGAGRKAVFVFAGDGPERARCAALARDLGVADRVRFLGSVDHDDVPHLMAASDLFVSTSRLTNKALPTCEALICGVPVVAYDVGDTASVVRTGETGALVPDGDTAALSVALTELLGDPGARSRMSAEAGRVARESFTGWDERIAMEMRVIEAVVAGSRNGGGRSPVR